MTRYARANDGNSACRICQFEEDLTATKIDGSVGLGGLNHKADVRKIQRLLSLIAPEDGGPTERLKDDGIVGPLTRKAILDFQQFQQTGSDSRVDPLGPTLKTMNEVPKRALALRSQFATAGGVAMSFEYETLKQRVLEAARTCAMQGPG